MCDLLNDKIINETCSIVSPENLPYQCGSCDYHIESPEDYNYDGMIFPIGFWSVHAVLGDVYTILGSITLKWREPGWWNSQRPSGSEVDREEVVVKKNCPWSMKMVTLGVREID